MEKKNKRMGMLEKKDTIHRPSAGCPVSRQLPSHLHHRSYVHSLASSTTTKIKLGNPGRRPSREPSTSSFPVYPLPGAMTISASRTIPHAQRAFLPPPPPPGSQQGWRGSLPGLWHPRPTKTLPSCGVVSRFTPPSPQTDDDPSILSHLAIRLRRHLCFAVKVGERTASAGGRRGGQEG